MPVRGRELRRRFAQSALAAFLMGVVPVASAADPRSDAAATDANTTREAKELARAGIAHYRAGRLEEARDAFAKAWTLKPSSELAASLAEVEMRLDRYADAAEHWTYYIQNLPPDRTEAEYQLAECRKHLGSVRVAVDTPGALVSLDGKLLGPAPLRVDLWVSPGSHVFDAKVAERAPATQRISIGPGEAQLVSLTLGGASAPERPAPATPAPDRAPAESTHGGGSSTAKTVVLVSGTALALAGLGVGVGFTVKSNHAAQDVDRFFGELKADGATDSSWCAVGAGQPLPPHCSDYNDAVTERKNARIVAITSFAAGGAFAVGTVLTALLWHDKPAEQLAKLPTVAVAHAGRDGGFVTVTGSF